MGRLGTLKPTVPARSSINPMKMVQTRQNCRKGFADNLSFPPMLLESQISSQPLAKRLILTFFHQSFLSRDAYDRALGRDVINGRSKLTSQPQFTSVRGRAHCIASVIASSTAGGSLGPFDSDKASRERQAIFTQPSDGQSPSPSSWFLLLFN